MSPTSPVSIRDTAREILEGHWRTEGYCVPNDLTYPYQWLWDSCFHAVAWAALGDGDKALAELRHLFRTQDRSGFVPHVDMEAAPMAEAVFWARIGSSSITQPPMYGHAVADLSRRGVAVPDELVDRSMWGVTFLAHGRPRDDRSWLVPVVHPWETGADDLPRWDHWYSDGFSPAAAYALKGELMKTIRRGGEGEPLANPAFAAAPAGFNALVAFNAAELADLTGDDGMIAVASELADALDDRWDPDLLTWVDAGDAADSSGRCRTIDALLATLVTRRADRIDAALRTALDPAAYGGAFGPAGVHRDEPAFHPRTYWRGSSWPQLTYLLWVAARRAGASEAEGELASRLVLGAEASGWAEHWDPDDGTGLGAAPQSWAALAAVVDAAGGPQP